MSVADPLSQILIFILIMSQKCYFSYVRVSTQRQGQHGTSLTEQKSAIERYARKFNLSINKSFEERETAAKSGRPVFKEMVNALRKGKASGVIIHKIDRSARNLRDWADLQSLTDSGIEIHFAAESLDLNSRGGRLSADIQAVVASDYIRNLREETIKGIYGRLKQGIYPFPAVIGYLDAGKGQPKKVDAVKAPLIRQAFEFYATGRWGLIALSDEMYRRGLRNKRGTKVTVNGLATILHNPFYIGLIKIVKTGEMFAGKHQPVIPKYLFDRVQAVFEGKNIKKTERHFFVFRRQVYCAKCRNLYIAEKQKGAVYYRCHTRNCTRGTVKEAVLEKEALKLMRKLRLNDLEYRYFKNESQKTSQNTEAAIEAGYRRLELLKDQIESRLSKLADAYVDGVFDKQTYTMKKNELLKEEQSVREQITNLRQNIEQSAKKMEEFLELLNCAYLTYKWGEPEEKHELVKSVFSNCEINEKNVLLKPYLPFQLMAERQCITAGSPYREAARTLGVIFKELLNYFARSDFSRNDYNFVNYFTSKTKKMHNNSFPEFNECGM